MTKVGVRAGVFTGGGGERKKPGPPGRTLELGWVGLLVFFFFPPKGRKPHPGLTPTCACCREGSQDGGGAV